MLTYKYLYQIGEELFFAYYPDGDENYPGIVAIKSAGNGRVVEYSEKYEDYIFKIFAFHAIYSIDITKEKGTIAWY